MMARPPVDTSVIASLLNFYPQPTPFSQFSLPPLYWVFSHVHPNLEFDSEDISMTLRTQTRLLYKKTKHDLSYSWAVFLI